MQMRNQQFLEAVLGAAGASALSKATRYSPEIQSLVLSRTVLAWIQAETEHDGLVPGIEGSYVSFSKSEAGFNGTIAIGSELHRFENASLFHLAASVAVAVDADHEIPAVAAVSASDIERLGKSIDIMARQQMIGREMAKNARSNIDAGCDIDTCRDCGVDPPGANSDCEACEAYAKKYPKAIAYVDELEKAKVGPGKPAGAIAPKPPEAPTASAPAPTTAAMTPKLPKPSAPPKLPKMKLSLSEASRKCPVCVTAQFRGDAFTGCLCLRDLAKHSKVVSTDDTGHTLQLSSAWDREAIATLLEAVGRS